MINNKGKLNKDLFENLFREHYEGLLYFSLSIVDIEDVARDIVHDSFVYMWNNKKDLDLSFSLKSYLYKIVRNNSLNYLKHQKVEQKYRDYILKIDNDSNTDIEKHEERILKLERKLKELTPRTREVIEKCFIEGLKYKEIAEELEISVNTVKTHIKNGLRTLRIEFREDYILFLMFLKNRKHQKKIKKS